MKSAREIAAQCWCDPETEHLEMIPELAEAFAKRIAQQAEELERLGEERRWIPVDERLPEVYEKVLLIVEGLRFIGCRAEGGWYDQEGSAFFNLANEWMDVTHWMPLPEHPSTLAKGE